MGWLEKLKHAAEIVGGSVIAYEALPLVATYIGALEAQAAGHYKQIPETIRGLLVAAYPDVNLDDVRFAESINTGHGAAVTLGSQIFFPRKVNLFHPDDLRWLLHELQHCQQYVKHGGVAQFLVHYIGNFAGNVIKHGTINVHDLMPLEQEALQKELAATPRCLIDPIFYLEAYEDLRTAFGNDSNAAIGHWYEFGINEGRIGSPAMDAPFYVGKYPDLQSSIGKKNYRGLLAHWLEYGIREGRAASAALDVAYYTSIHSDLQAAFGDRLEAAVKHWFDFGMSEGRASSPTLAVRNYVARYPDLQAAFGDNWEAAIRHYLINGIKEGRVAT